MRFEITLKENHHEHCAYNKFKGINTPMVDYRKCHPESVIPNYLIREVGPAVKSVRKYNFFNILKYGINLTSIILAETLKFGNSECSLHKIGIYNYKFMYANANRG